MECWVGGCCERPGPQVSAKVRVGREDAVVDQGYAVEGDEDHAVDEEVFQLHTPLRGLQHVEPRPQG